LPGRASEAAALGLVGAGARWMPWSVAPARSLASLLALIPPAAAMVLMARAGTSSRWWTLAAIAAIGLVSVVVGAGQLAGGESRLLRFYGESHIGFLTGFQANRNAAADVLLIAMLALAALDVRSKPAWRPLTGAALAALAVAVFLTGSRAGIALMAPVLAGIAVWRGREPLRRLRPRARLAGTFGVLAATAAVVLVLAANPTARRMAARFSQGHDPRPELWTDTLYAIGQTWPMGSGLGSFVPVFVAAERLEVVDQSFPNRAHNDYLEFVLEAGLPGLVVLSALAAWLIWRLVVGLRRAESEAARAELVFAGATLALLGLHSVVDYPLRSMALATLAGVAAGIILAADGRRASSSPRPRVEGEEA
jgi:O-antigen ligase